MITNIYRTSGGGNFKIGNYKRLVAVNHESQSKSTDGSKSGWRQGSVGVVVIVVVVAMYLPLEW